MKNWYSIKGKAAGTAEIKIYDEIGMWGVSARQFSDELAALGQVKNINLHIHSPGGDVFDGIVIYNLLSKHPATLTVYIDGLAASMASAIVMAGDKVVMPENAMMMIHKPCPGVSQVVMPGKCVITLTCWIRLRRYLSRLMSARQAKPAKN